jgi:hypothetical protein
MSKTIDDIKNDVNRFIFEAEECAKAKYGFAAMSTIFSVVFSISDSILTTAFNRNYNDKELIDYFIPKMNDKSWIVSRENKTISDLEIINEMNDIRNGLAHQLSLPSYIGLINNKTEAKENFNIYPHISRVIAVQEFIEQVKITANDLIINNTNAIHDPNPRGKTRSNAVRVILPSGTSASPASFPKK